MLYLTGYIISFQTIKCIVWAMSDSMPRNTFERILQNLHLCDNDQLDK